MDNYKFGEPWKWRPGPDKDRGDVDDHRGNPVGWGLPYGHEYFGKRVIAVMNFCAGMDVPEVTGGLKDLIETAEIVVTLIEGWGHGYYQAEHVRKLNELLAQFEKEGKG